LQLAAIKAKSVRARIGNSIEGPKNNWWVFTALLGGVLFSIGNFFMGNISTGGLYAREIVAVGNFIASIIYCFIVGKLFFSKF
jgi:hypothetical protein